MLLVFRAVFVFFFGFTGFFSVFRALFVFFLLRTFFWFFCLLAFAENLKPIRQYVFMVTAGNRKLVKPKILVSQIDM